ncbi:Shedu anti-phage system protein SduA domain-containing protein [Agrobacterium salinitolerans]|uniref:Shedu anti-phage system protein SduA domain-containing protein n=1 Tax=Agrobacterium salinitolerans TaxID=1183413 RepID=UPI0015738676|nr:Shedu anti-phage system protein SduA domain-containing protein [Agrobacterium salinitolerans]NTA40293.1 DUF4263 domain-containing protein [Agrobacterium salinitolerans]
MKPDEKLLRDFYKILDSEAPPGRKKEQVVQDFLEVHSELIPILNSSNYALQFRSVISKFRLSPAFETDYVYITKNSARWDVNFVELESPDKAIFTSNLKEPTTSADSNAAVGQVRCWRVHVEANKSETIQKLRPLLLPPAMTENPIRFHYQLIIGRSANKNLGLDRKQHFDQICRDTGLDILTYDQLADIYVGGPRIIKNVLRQSKNRYAFKSTARGLENVLSQAGPGLIDLSKAQCLSLKEDGYDIDSWLKGELLGLNGKEPIRNWRRRAQSSQRSQ